MIPQSFSDPVVGSNGKIYCAPYGLNGVVDWVLKLDPETFEIKKIPLAVDNTIEKWSHGISHGTNVYFLPYNACQLLIIDTITDECTCIDIADSKLKGKHLSAHVYQGKLFSLPYGSETVYDNVLVFDLSTNIPTQIKLNLPRNDLKKWHTTQMINGKIYGLPRGEAPNAPYFPYGVIFNCDSLEYELLDLSSNWGSIDQQLFSNKKYTTMAKVNDELWAPPYSENDNFDLMAHYDGEWNFYSTGIKNTSRKYFCHTVAKNGKIYFPPAGHDPSWSEMLIVDPCNKSWRTLNLGLGKESKKYFTGVENSQGKIYHIPRGGCVCEPEDSWKIFGDLSEVLVIGTHDDSFYFVDISDFFVDNTTIEKYNSSVIVNDCIFAFPYGQSPEFQNILVFDTRKEKIIKKIDLATYFR